MLTFSDIFFVSTGLMLILFLLLGALVLAFEIWMIVDAIQNKKISDEARILWIIGMLLLHPIVAIIYYFTDHRKKT